MSKIKIQKKMKLPELIEHIVKTGHKMASYSSNDNSAVVEVGSLQGIHIDGTIFPYETFTVEVEEEITEDMEITALVELSSRGLLGKTTLYRYQSINDVIDNQSVAFYILNDDQKMDLIWKNGKLVE